MGSVKSNNYTLEECQFALIGRALSHPVRRRIMDSLITNGWRKNIELSKDFNLSVPTIKEHLTILKEANLIRTIYAPHHYEIRPHIKGFKAMREYLNELHELYGLLE